MSIAHFVLLAAVLNLLLAFYVGKANYRNPLNISFGFFGFLVGIWVFLNSLFNFYPNKFLLNAIYSIGPYIIITILIWLYYFREKTLSPKFLTIIILLYGISTLFLVLSFLPQNLLIAEVSSQYDYRTGLLFSFYSIYLISLFFGFTLSAFFLYRSAEAFLKKQLLLIFSGMGIVILMAATFGTVLPALGYSQLNVLDSASSIIFVFFAAYAILRQQLLNIKVIFTEVIVYFLLVSVFTVMFLTSGETGFFIRLVFMAFLVYGGIRLVESIKREVQQRELLEKLTQELQSANQKLKELDDQKDEFISIAAHDLNTPIATIEGYLSMVLDEKIVPVDNPKTKEYLMRVYEGSKRLAALVADLLNVSRIEQGRLIIERESLQLEELVEKIVKEWEIKARDQRLGLIYEKPSSPLPKIYADPDRLSQVVTNLVSNAIKYSLKGEIKVRLAQKENNIVLEVTDEGMGISKEDLPHLFEKFYRVSNHTTKGIAGTGLGLFISKGIVELHGGKISVESEKGKGSTFKVELPIATKEEIAKGREEVESPASQKVAQTEEKIIEKAAEEE